MTFGSVILSNHLALGLENKAFREGLLTQDDFVLRDHLRPTLLGRSLSELQAIDMLCLYDEVWMEPKRFGLHGLSKSVGDQTVRERPAVVRTMEISLIYGGKVSWDAPSCLEKLKRDASIDVETFNALRNQSAREAAILTKRSLRLHIEDARACFEIEAPTETTARLYDRPIPHEAVRDFLLANASFIVENLQIWFGRGEHNHFLDEDYLEDMGCPPNVVRPLRLISRSFRFDSYFRHVQEAYSTYFENAFFGRLQGLQLAYDRAPDGPKPPGLQADAATLSRIIRINLADVVDYFPLPRTIEEALEYKQHPRLRTFRKVLKRWLAQVGNDEVLESRLRHDLQLANRDLTKLKHWRHLKQQPLFFGVKTTLSLVPVAGYFVTAVDAIDYFCERMTERRHAWVVSPRSHLD